MKYMLIHLYLGSRLCVSVIVLSCVMSAPKETNKKPTLPSETFQEISDRFDRRFEALLEKEEPVSKQEKQAEKRPSSTGSATSLATLEKDETRPRPTEIQRLLALANEDVPVCKAATTEWTDSESSVSEEEPVAKQEQKRPRKSEKETNAKAP